MSAPLLASDRAPGLFVAPDVVIPDDAEIAPHVTIYSGVALGNGVSLEQGAVLGRPQQIHARSRSPVRPEGAPPDRRRLSCGQQHRCRCRCPARFRRYLSDNVLVREAAVIAEDAMIGRGTSVSHSNVIGARTRIQNDSLVGPWTVLEEDVLVSPRVTFVGDPTMGRRAADAASGGSSCGGRAGSARTRSSFRRSRSERRRSWAPALVRDDVPPRTVVAGNPARHLRAVRDDELLEGWGKPA